MNTWRAHKSGDIDWLDRSGKGLNIVLLHGIGSNARSFTSLVPYLPADARLIAWNAPGYLESSPLGVDWPVAEDYSESLVAFLDSINVQTAVIIGHSLGCLMAGAFALKHPERVMQVVFASPALGHNVSPGSTLSDGAQARIDDLEKMGPADFAAARASRLVWKADANPEIEARVQAGMSQVSMPGYGQAARMLASGRLLDDAANLTVPADVIVGDQDVITPPEAAMRLYNALPTQIRGKFTGIAAAGHALYQQAPAEFAQALCLPISEGVFADE